MIGHWLWLLELVFNWTEYMWAPGRRVFGHGCGGQSWLYLLIWGGHVLILREKISWTRAIYKYIYIYIIYINLCMHIMSYMYLYQHISYIIYNTNIRPYKMEKIIWPLPIIYCTLLYKCGYNVTVSFLGLATVLSLLLPHLPRHDRLCPLELEVKKKPLFPSVALLGYLTHWWKSNKDTSSVWFQYLEGWRAGRPISRLWSHTKLEEHCCGSDIV